MTKLISSQRLWLSKFKRRFWQYSTLAIRQPKWLLMFAFSRIYLIRYFLQYISKRPLTNINSGQEDSIFENLDVDQVVKTLKNDGLYLGIFLPEHILNEILDFAKNTTYLGNGKNEYSFSFVEKEKAEIKYGKKFSIGYNFDAAKLCPAIEKLAKDPKLWEIAAKYLENIPLLLASQIWWTFADGEAEERSRGFYQFHYDPEDYSCLKFMFYLTDVDLQSGAHICVKGSHKKKKLAYQFSLIRERNTEEIIEYYGNENVVTICKKAGFGFAEDPFCFHKGTIPIKNNRLILEFKFALNNYGIIL